MGIPREPEPSIEGRDKERGEPSYGDENNDNHCMNSFRAPTRSSCGGELNTYTFENSTSSDAKSNCRNCKQDVNKTFIEPYVTKTYVEHWSRAGTWKTKQQ